jgi:uncharacterized membrane protein YhfC
MYSYSFSFLLTHFVLLFNLALQVGETLFVHCNFKEKKKMYKKKRKRIGVHTLFELPVVIYVDNEL